VSEADATPESTGTDLTDTDPSNVDVSEPADHAPDPAGVNAHLSVEELLATLEAVTVERDQYLADLQRVGADFSNFRKQTEKRNVEFAAQAGSRLAEALLPVLDACDAAARQGVDGVDPIAAQLRGVLENAGLEFIVDENEAFDPNRHEAAMSEPGEDGQEALIVAEVLRTGYAWNGRVLRAAMVKVKG
jgi:molecular chaperone GrpE